MMRSVPHNARRHVRTTEFVGISLAVALLANDLWSQQQNQGAKANPPRRKSSEIAVRHADLSLHRSQTKRLAEREDVWVHITDANPLIYDYSLTGDVLTPDTQAQEDARRLLGVSTTTRGQQINLASGSEGKFVDYANKLLGLAGSLAGIIADTDVQGGTTSTLIIAAKAAADQAVKTSMLAVETTSIEVARQELQTRWQALSAQEQVQHAALRDAVNAIIPAVVNWRRRIQIAPVGPIRIKYDYPGSGDYRIQLAVGNRLGADYEPNRWVGQSADVAVARPRFRAIQGSVGLGGVFGKRVENSLTKVSNPATPDTFKLSTREVRKFSYLPVTFLSGQVPVRQWGPNVVAAVSVGLGLKGDEINDLGQATDLLGALTIGYDWLRASFGGAYTAEVVGISGISADGLTTDPNALNNPNLDRKFRWFFGLHMAR